MRICGTYKFSILQISQALSSMSTTHLIYRAHSEINQHLKKRVGEGYAPVLIADGLKSIRKKKGLTIVSAPRAELAMTNIPMLTGDDLVADVKNAFTLDEIELEVSPPSIMDFVNTAVKPSYLMAVQTAIYKVSNAAVRKNAQTRIIQFLDSRLSLTALCKILKDNYSTSDLVELVSKPEALIMREAILRVRKGEDILAVELSTKVTSFDLLYIIRSSDLSLKALAC